MIHPTALVADDAILGANVTIGPFCVVGFDGTGDAVRIGDDAVLRSHVVVYRGTSALDGLHVGHHAVLRESSSIGTNVSVGTHTIVEHHVTIGDGVRLHSGCFVPEHSVLEAGAWLGPGVIVTNARYPNRPDTKDNLEGVRIGPSAIVGAGAVLLPGVTIGPSAFVGAGAVVVRDVPQGGRVVGNPARAIG